MEAAASGAPKLENSASTGLPKARVISARASTSEKGGNRSCRCSSALRHLHADDIGPRRQHLAKLDIGRSQPFQRAAQPRAGIGLAARERPAPARPAARRHEEDARNWQIGTHHRRQAECMAAMPPERLRTLT